MFTRFRIRRDARWPPLEEEFAFSQREIRRVRLRTSGVAAGGTATDGAAVAKAFAATRPGL